MDYFQILNLNREPFSNSPEPELFYESGQHVRCLQKLELSIRLRRGLNVIIGDVGTGKTTMCRQLICKFSMDERDRENIGMHLVLDPSFSTTFEFLKCVARTFDISYSIRHSEYELKEKIKDYLFTKGVTEGKTVVLIIDEGQKIPASCLELLREFLNYETNEYKLLQIVIFAQKEFETVLKSRANISDRINLYYSIGPLGLREASAMIRHRLQASGLSDPGKSFFTLSALLTVYFLTGGYPRKIVTLCHQVILAMIIQNRMRAGVFLVWSCARRGLPTGTLRMRWMTASVVSILFAGIAVWAAHEHSRVDNGKVSVLPEPSALRENRLESGRLWVQVYRSNDEGKSKKVMMSYPESFPAVRLVGYENRKEGKVYAVVLNKTYKDRAAAADSIWFLKGAGFSNVKILDKWEKDTVFF